MAALPLSVGTSISPPIAALAKPIGTEHQRKLLKEFDDSLQKGGAKHSPTGNSWTDKLKSFFG